MSVEVEIKAILNQQAIQKVMDSVADSAETMSKKSLSSMEKFSQGFQKTFAPSVVKNTLDALAGGSGGKLGIPGIIGQTVGLAIDFALLRGKKAISEFNGQTGLRLQASAVGIVPRAIQDSGLGLGYGAADTISQTLAFQRAGGNVSGSTIGLAQAFGRGFGIDPSSLSGAYGQIRGQGATGENLERRFADLLATAFNSKLESGRIGELLDATSSSVQALESQGTYANPATVAATISSLMTTNGIMSSPGRVGSELLSVDQQIRAGSGFNLGVNRQIFAGLMPGSSPFAQMMQMKYGMFGMGEDIGSLYPSLRPEEKAYFTARNKNINPRSVLKAMSGQFNQMTGGMNDETKEMFASMRTNLSGVEGLNLLRRAGEGTLTDADISKFKDANKTSEETLKDISTKAASITTSTEGAVVELRSLNESNLVKMGSDLMEGLAPLIKALLIGERATTSYWEAMGPIGKAVTNPIGALTGKDNVVDYLDAMKEITSSQKELTTETKSLKEAIAAYKDPGHNSLPWWLIHKQSQSLGSK